jgi:hypothetical protein
MDPIITEKRFDTLQAVAVRKDGHPVFWPTSKVREFIGANTGSLPTSNAVYQRLVALEDNGLVRARERRDSNEYEWQLTGYGKQVLGRARRQLPGVQS